MSKMASFLAARKGQSSVKASADTALQTILALEEPSDAHLLESIAEKKKLHTDEWGAEDSDTETMHLGSSVVVGGHLHLISEEDVTRKLNRKGPKKWGDVKKPVSELASGDPLSAQVKPSDTSCEESSSVPTPSGVSLYRPPRIMRNKIDVESHQLFPDLEAVETKIAPSGHNTHAATKKKTHEERPKLAATSVEPKPDTTTTDSEVPFSVMAIEEFLKDIVVPELNVTFNDEASRQKFVGRKKRPVVPLPAAELTGRA